MHTAALDTPATNARILSLSDEIDTLSCGL